MKIGDEVKLVDEEGIFTVKKIVNKDIVVEDQYGFEITYPISKAISNSLSKNIHINEIEIPFYKDIKVKKEIFVKEESREVDLHIGHLVDNMKAIKPHNMLNKQLIAAEKEINKAKEEKIKKLILIHGKGTGKLKQEIYKLLSTIKGIEYFEADIIKYKFGAVEIRFK